MNNLRCFLNSGISLTTKSIYSRNQQFNFKFSFKKFNSVPSSYNCSSINQQRSIHSGHLLKKSSLVKSSNNRFSNLIKKSSVQSTFINKHTSFYSSMAPIIVNYDSYVEKLITDTRVLIFSKTTCPFCVKVKGLFNELGVAYHVVEVDKENGSEIHEALKKRVGKTSVPQVFVNRNHVGGCDDTYAAQESGKLGELLQASNYDYDLIVIGGGSGGLAASKEASKLGKKVALLDFVKPSHQGTTWGIGGTCVNVGCIPKKLMHQAALVGQAVKHSNVYGWQTENGETLDKIMKHNWERMVEAVQANIKSSNFKYRVALRNEKVNYINSYGTLVDNHTIKLTDKAGKESTLTSKDFLIATGERPRLPDDCEGAELAITSDDLFSLPKSPGKTVVVGASYVALECAGFIKGFNLDVSVMVRSILLRGFDQEMAEKIGQYMAHEGVKFHRPCVPKKIELISEEPRLLRVTGVCDDGSEIVEECETVLFAIGRKPCTDNIGLENVGVAVEKSGKIPVVNEQTNVPNIYAVGDILHKRPELTPVAIEAGLRLVNRLYNNRSEQCDYTNVPTTIFTPLEYGCVGLSEEDAVKQYGEDNLEIYVQNSTPFEWTIAHHLDNKCFGKLITLRNENERVIGFHFLGPNAGEITQFAALALKKNATKAEFDSLIGIHPTCAELFTSIRITKRSGISPMQALCCG